MEMDLFDYMPESTGAGEGVDGAAGREELDAADSRADGFLVEQNMIQSSHLLHTTLMDEAAAPRSRLKRSQCSFHLLSLFTSLSRTRRRPHQGRARSRAGR